MFKPWRFSKTSIKLETSFWLKGGRGFQKCIPSNHPITYQRYQECNRHTPRSIRYIPHDYRSNRTTHYRHDKQRRSKLGLCTRIPQCRMKLAANLFMIFLLFLNDLNRFLSKIYEKVIYNEE